MSDTPSLKTALQNKDQHIGPPNTLGEATETQVNDILYILGSLGGGPPWVENDIKRSMSKPEAALWLDNSIIFDENTPINECEGTPTACHANARRLAKEHKDYCWFLGFSMHEDPAANPWYGHSWIVDARDGSIQETTVPAKRYVGFNTSDKEACHELQEMLDEECGVDEWLSGDFEVCDIHG